MTKLLNNIQDLAVIVIVGLVPLIFIMIFVYGLLSLTFPNRVCAGERLATMSANRFLGDSTSNPFSLYNNRFNPDSPYNRFGRYGNPYSPYSVNNPYAVDGPGIYVEDDE